MQYGKFFEKKNARAELGRAGEAAAKFFLEKSGMRILCQNWRPAGARHSLELDIVALSDEMLVFVEVKTRSDGKRIPIHTAFSAQKRNHILEAAQCYLAETGEWQRSCRFDLLCLTFSDNTFSIEHFEHVIEIGQTLDSRNTSWQPW